ncbi:hypothetical protein FPV67DRAFT_1419025, partial [Lyophyllum atratum]
ELRVNFGTSVYPAATFNIGPTTVSLLHTDGQNSKHNFCALTVAGSFDSKLGGHLILYDLGIVIEFPRGSTILIPSALLRHANTAIQRGERRVSFTQFCAGGLLRYVGHGCATDTSIKDANPDTWKAILAEMDTSRAPGVDFFSKFHELAADRAAMFQNLGL